MNDDDDLIWLEAWLSCCDNALANFLLTAEFGSVADAHYFLRCFKRAKTAAIESLKEVIIFD
ncbi:hypothetical protein H6F86_20705 [Phormidium sp. FACHB-592]|uniref:HEPN domain-containing protein n=1 Tax=Stenomitos frigidus AS-A4 TaxID=2933935 RepID=A0ABV0KH41_9CYAN|nr:hypothetical protein [Phormidium sp. FACHB-592]MBD2076254.1 hypothetical protein [Phormidium sp. FACHB-592]